MVCQGGCDNTHQISLQRQGWSFICFLIVAVSGVLASLLSSDLYLFFATIAVFAGIFAVWLFIAHSGGGIDQ